MVYIIGTVGPFGSGCSYIANLIKEKHQFKYISLSEILRKMYDEEYGNGANLRKELQDFGDKIRREKGCDYLAKQAREIIEKNPNANYIVDSIRNPGEVDFLKKQYSNFYLFGVFAEPEIRWKRVQEKYHDNYGEFALDDKRDSDEKTDFGQKVTDTFRESDIIILNNKNVYIGNEDYNTLSLEVEKYIDLIERKIPFKPTVDETCMAVAYANSMRSSCLKRQVGAVIVDEYGNIFSSGYNEVPNTQRPCQSEWGRCYRDKLKADFKERLDTDISDPVENQKIYESCFKSFKILDYCRALHAEENAILNVARIGASAALKSATLYTSTYPCNMCANKIAQVGIRNVVYFEPYPMPEAKKILADQKVTQMPFKGVTYNGYFRLMEVIT